MARVTYTELVKEVHGAAAPGQIFRQKRYRDARGKIIGCAHAEHYDITHPRDWEKTPARKDELTNQKSWGKSCFLTEALLKTDAGCDYLQQRFTNQLPSTRGSHPDPLASIDSHTKSAKRYIRFDAYCRAIIRNLLKLTRCNAPAQTLQALQQHE